VPESSRHISPTLVRALALARDALADAPGGLLTDIDGTLSAMVDDPGQARLADGAASALTALAARLAVVAVITGRAATDARRLVGVPELLVVGNHGTEWLEPGAMVPVLPTIASDVEHALATVLARVPLLSGVMVEEKGLSATVHLRAAADPEHARAAVLAAIADPGPAIEVRRGRMSVELRPVGLGDKGAAVRAIVESYRLRGVVVMGDDVTDLDMFSAVRELRDAGRLRAAIIAVGAGEDEVPPEVHAAADLTIADPGEAAALLTALAG
jgi:trehalose 6-phosphate phosphatase